MSTIFNIRNLPLPNVSRTGAVVLVLLVAAATGAGVVGWRVYRSLTTVNVTAYFHQTTGLYRGDKVMINGIRVGAIDKIEPAGDKTKVSFHYAKENDVPADAAAVILNPSLVASRSIQLTPGYTGGSVMQNNAVIPVERTQVPVEWDELRGDIDKLLTQLGPTSDSPKGPLGEVIESFADGLSGKGDQLNTTLKHLSDALTALSEGRGDFFGVVRSLAMFVNTLRRNDQQFVAVNTNLAQFTNGMTNSDAELATALQQIDAVLKTTRTFVSANGPILSKDINNLAELTNTLMQPTPRNGLETALHVLPTMAANVTAIYEPAHGSISALPALPNFANPLQFMCSAIQAASRRGYQESAELCAQYLAPILDAIKFNYPPVGFNLFSTADLLPSQVGYSEERLRPPPGFKNTTVPGVWAPDTAQSHGNREPGWKIAPGMEGLELQQLTRNMVAPEDLASLMGLPMSTDNPPPATGEPVQGPGA